MQDKFLTIFASFDDDTQLKLKNLQQIILRENLQGTQTMDIPFHISLGSFPLSYQKQLESKIIDVCSTQTEFSLTLKKIRHFGGKVLFIEPEKNHSIDKLHKIFEGYFADKFKFCPHITLFCGDKTQTKMAKKLIKSNFKPFVAKITSICLAEFFPTKILVQQNLQKD